MLYPPGFGDNPLFPRSSDFTVVECGEKYGKGVICHRNFQPGELIAEFAGELRSEICQHTLQISPDLHILDPYFVGYLLHACDPNVTLDMQKRRVTALRPIQPGDYLTMDYAQTEDHLFRQFRCSCGAASCRGWIMGRKDVIDEQALGGQQQHKRTKRRG